MVAPTAALSDSAVTDCVSDRVVDLSSGNGMCTLACAALGATHTVATEIPVCIHRIERNIELNQANVPGKMSAMEFMWGYSHRPCLSAVLPTCACLSILLTA